MDALARLEPVARPVLDEVDQALATLGAPAEHPVWALLRTLGTTPADAVTYFADVQPAALRQAAEALAAQAGAYDALVLPRDLAWSGSAADAYQLQVGALTDHLAGPSDEASLRGRAAATAAFLHATADWFTDARNRVAHALADVLGSAQAVTLRTGPALGHGAVDLARAPEGAVARSVLAAADIGVWILDAAEQARSEGRSVLEHWSGELTELVFRPPALPAARIDATVHLHR